MIWCKTCNAGFVTMQEHDRKVGPWNGHPTEEIDMQKMAKARWMAFCPVCMDAAASGTPEAGFTEKHPTVATGPNGDDVLQCSECGTRYRFNLGWTFDKKEVPPKRERRHSVFVVTYQDEVEAFSTPTLASERLEELEAEALEENGYARASDPGWWESPLGELLEQSEAVMDLEHQGLDAPSGPEEVTVVDR